MIKMEKLIGKVLHTKQSAIDAEKAAWAWVFKKMPAVVEAYETIGLGSFDSEVFTLLKNGQRATIEARAEEQLEKETQGFKIPVIRNSAREHLHTLLNLLFDAWNAVEQTRKASYHNPTLSTELNWNEITYQDGNFIVDHEASRKRHETVIENEDEAEMYQLALETKHAFDKLGAFLKDRGLSSSRYAIISHSGVLYEKDNTLEIRPTAIKVLEFQKRREEYLKVAG